MEGLEGIWRFGLIALLAVIAGAGMGILLGGAESDPFETVIKTVAGEGRTVTETETETVTKTKTETVTDAGETADPLDGGTRADDDADGDNCSDSYAPACVDPSDGYNDLDCNAIGDKDFSSTGDDPHGLDPDQNGVACESK